MALLERCLAVVGALAGILGCVVGLLQGYRTYRWKRRITWDDSLRVAEGLLQQIEAGPWKPDIVVGLGRSGGIWGGWLAGNLGTLPFAVVNDKYTETPSGREVCFPGGEDVLSSLGKMHGGGTKVLLIEGATAVGRTWEVFLEQFKGNLEHWDVRTAVLYRNPASTAPLDFVGKDLVPWPTDSKPFPWHHRAAYRPHLGDIVPRRRYGRPSEGLA